MKLLILTDHHTHAASDSIYRICHGFSTQGFFVHLASRGTLENSSFFSGENACLISTRILDRTFGYENIDSWFMSSSFNKIEDFDAILLRLDSPVSESWLNWLAANVPIEIVNNPKGICKTRKREYLLELNADAIPSKYLTSLDSITEALSIEDSVIKLDDTFGGSGIMLFSGPDRIKDFQNLPAHDLRRISKNISVFGGVLLQRYTPRVNLGDKRFVVAFGKLLGSFTRTPRSNGWLCNLSQGGEISFQDHTEYENQLVHRVDKKLAKLGVPIYGIDTLVDTDGTRRVSELNVTNPGGFIQIQDATHSDVIGKVAYLLDEYLASLH